MVRFRTVTVSLALLAFFSEVEARETGFVESNFFNSCASLELSPARFELKQEFLETTVQQVLAKPKPQVKNPPPPGQSSSFRKSRGRAFLQSLLLPGWGQHYAESPRMMRVFATSEVLLLGSFIGFTKWSDWREDDYRAFAVEHASINLNEKSERYFGDISIFDDIDEFNQAQLRNRDVTTLYNNRTDSFWKWDSEENRLKYANIRFGSNNAENRARLMLAAIFVNHLASAVHSTLSVFKFNKRLEKQEIGLRFDVEPTPQTGQRISIRLEKRF